LQSHYALIYSLQRANHIFEAKPIAWKLAKKGFH